MDVVYNHLGPEGNYLGDFGYYFTQRYRTSWGAAINFDEPCSDEVRRYFIENPRYWITQRRIDALRWDGLPAILAWRGLRPRLASHFFPLRGWGREFEGGAGVRNPWPPPSI